MWVSNIDQVKSYIWRKKKENGYSYTWELIVFLERTILLDWFFKLVLSLGRFFIEGIEISNTFCVTFANFEVKIKTIKVIVKTVKQWRNYN